MAGIDIVSDMADCEGGGAYQSLQHLFLLQHATPTA